MERRYHESQAGHPVICRHCWAYQPLTPERLELKDGRAWYRCGSCNDWYLVRWDDAVALLAPEDRPRARPDDA